MKRKQGSGVLKTLGLSDLNSGDALMSSSILWAQENIKDYFSNTYGVKNKNGIEELRAIDIGGVKQWIHIRGRRKENPVLFVIHGGPGAPFIGMMDAIQRPWEDFFTVVQWDQRQTGKSYYPSSDEAEPLTIERFIEDAIELTRYLLGYLSKERVTLLAHSWGTVLGMHLVKRHPEWIFAYIGVGQVVNWIDNEKELFSRLESHALRMDDNKLLRQLQSISPYPDPKRLAESFIENTLFLRTELNRLAGETLLHNWSWDDGMRIFNFSKTISPHLTNADLGNIFFGESIALLRSPSVLTQEFMEIDLVEDVGTSFEVPIFLFTGIHDWHTSWQLSDKWFKSISAPYKELIHFNDSSHFPIFEEPGHFLVSLVNKVLPYTKIDAKSY